MSMITSHTSLHLFALFFFCMSMLCLQAFTGAVLQPSNSDLGLCYVNSSQKGLQVWSSGIYFHGILL